MDRLITRSELTGRTGPELSVLFRQATEALCRARPGSPEHRAALASLDNIARERAARRGPRPG